MKPDRWATQAVASVLGLLVAALDLACPFGDDSAQFSVFLWLLFSGLLGFARPRRPWLWAILVGPWLPLTHLVIHALGLPDPIHPNTMTRSSPSARTG